MKYKFSKIISLGISLLLLGGLLSGCGLSQSAEESSANKEKTQVKTYVVATRGTMKPFTYLDDKEQLTGYDIEILKEVEKRNPQIHFEFKTMSIESAFVAIGSSQVDLIANQMAKNPDRESKYIFTDIPNNYTSTKLAVKGNRQDIQTLKDMEGKTMILTPTSEIARKIKDYNDTAAVPIKTIFTDKGSSEALNVVATGRADSAPSYEVNVKEVRETLGVDVNCVGPVLSSVPTYYILRQDESGQELVKILNKTIQDMKDDGTLRKLSEQFLGSDYTDKVE